MSNLIEFEFPNEVLNTPVSSLGAGPGTARIGVIVDFTGLKKDLSNISSYVREMETNRVWNPADKTRVARNPFTGKDFYAAGENVKMIVFGLGASPVDHRTFFNTPNTTVDGEAYATNGKTVSEMLKAVAGKKVKCTEVKRIESDERIMGVGAEARNIQVPSYVWEIIK